MDEFRREVHFKAARDTRDGQGGGSQHCVDIIWYLHGPEGTVQFVLFTGWYKSIIAAPAGRSSRICMRRTRSVLPADLGYHWKTPRYEGQGKTEPCLLVEGGCYYDGSGLNANRMFSVLVHEGGEAVWVELEKEYERIASREVMKAEGEYAS